MITSQTASASARVGAEEERLCPKCREHWPLDTEFFRLQADGRFATSCRACESEERARWRAARAAKGK